MPYFVKVMPIDYKKALDRMRQTECWEDETISATEEVYSEQGEGFDEAVL